MTEPLPSLDIRAGQRPPEAVVLVLHGGRESSPEPVTARQLAVLRMVPFASVIARRAAGRVAVARLRYRLRGWNARAGRPPAPVADADWALHRLTQRFGPLPVGLVGHSMGGRTALRIGGTEQVRAVVGLAPWLPPGEPVEQLRQRQVLLVHGTDDRLTDPRLTAAFADRLQAAGGTVSLVRVSGGRHAMLRRPQLWHELAAQFVLNAVLPNYRPSGWPHAPNFLHQVGGASARITY
ncbi:MAG TPA: alpha/beta fold hydrolase [Jatrophihabitans sp.]|nr:alpha/beta fold hydrolase [Jatrophihabitans sp.]